MNPRLNKIIHSVWLTADETRVLNKVGSLLRRDKKVGIQLCVLFEDIIFNAIKKGDMVRL